MKVFQLHLENQKDGGEELFKRAKLQHSLQLREIEESIELSEDDTSHTEESEEELRYVSFREDPHERYFTEIKEIEIGKYDSLDKIL